MGILGVKTDEWRTFRQLPDSDLVYQVVDEMVTSEEERENGGILFLSWMIMKKCPDPG